MNNFIIVEKDSLNKVNVNSQKIVLNEASIVHTKMHRADVAEFVQDGNNLLLKLKDGNVITIENFFLTYDDVKSDLVFEEDDCVLYWFDGVSGFNGISGLEVLLPEAGSKLATILPWLVGAGVVGGIAAALNNDDDKDSIPNGTITTQISSAGDISGTVTNVPAGTEVQITIKGQDKDGNALEQTITTTVDADGNYTAEVPADFADGDIPVNAETTDRNGNMISAEDKLTSAKTDDPVTGGLDREEGSIEVDVDNKGNITGTTTDVVAGSTVVITVEGFDKDGNPIQEEVVAIVQPDGSYTAEVPADFADGSSIDVEATTTDRNGNTISDTDSLAGRVEDDPTTPEDESVPGGLDRIDGAITVDVENNGNITGGTTDVVPGSEVTLTITGQDKDGNPLEREVTTTVDADGNYTTEVPADFADGDITVKAETVDRNGNPVDAEDSLVKTDHDNDPNTPDQGGLDRVEGAITVDIVETGAITGTTTGVAPGTDVVLTITGKDADGNNVTISKTVTTDASGNYSSAVTVADGIVDGSAVTVVANTTDRNGQGVGPATDSIAAQGDNDTDPTTPEDTGLDLVTGAITVDIVETGAITGTTTDVAPGTDVVLTITGKDADGNNVTISKTVTTDASGNYSSAVTVADGIVDGSAVTVVANTTDRNGQGVGPATDSIAAQGDNDTDPTTPEDTGLDLVTGAITVDIVETGAITGTTTDVAPGTDVVLTITGTDANGNPVTISKTVTTDASGNYSSAVTVADGIVDGSAVTVVANTTDRNGQGVGPATDSIAAQGDNDTDPTTPEDTGLDLVTGAITVDIVETGAITGTTTDVAPGTDVVLTITGKDADGNNVTISKTVTTDASGNYSSAVTVADGIVDGSAVTVVANTTDRNGQGVGPATDSIAAQGDNDTDPTTPEDTGLDLVTGAITVDIVETGAITGTTTDVAPGTDVVLTITGTDANGNPVTISKTVTTDASGNYSSAVTVADGIVDGSAVTVVANTTDRNGQGVGPATDSIAAQGDNDTDPTTPEDTGLDLVTGAITVDIVETGAITGTTTDVAPGTDVVLTITGKDADGNNVTISKTVTTDASGNYSSAVTVADGIVDGSAVTVVANTTDRNGQGVGPATDSIAAQGDNDTDPTTPEDTGLDLVTGAITVDIVETGAITGTTTDVAPGTDVVLTITGKDANGNPVTISKTVTTDASGNYSSAVTVADGIVDGSAVTVVANTTDRNGQGVGPATDSIAAQGDNDTDPTTPEDTGLDLVTGAITVDIVETGAITGTTTDVAPGTDVVLTITGTDANGNPVTISKTVTTDASGNYSSAVTVADGIVDGSAVTVVANTTDRNGQGVGPATDSIAAQGDNDTDPTTPEDTGLDLVTGAITVDIVETGAITGTTTDVAPGTDVVLTITGKDANGNPVTISKTVTTDASGNYSSAVTVADGIVDGSAVTVVANTTDRNGQGVGPATDSIAAQGDNDTDPTTPEDTGLDLVTGAITVDIVETGAITGTTTDVAPGTDVVLTITGTDANGNPVTISKTVTTDASGNYSSAVTVADGIVDGSAVTVVANTTDRNGQGVGPATDSIAAQGDNDTDPTTPEDTGLDLVTGAITVDIVETGAITGTTTDVAPGTDVVLTITGTDANGNPVTISKTVTTDASGNYSSAVTVADGIVDGSAVTVVANTTDRNGQGVGPATDSIAAQGDNDTDPTTPEDTGLDLVTGAITVDIVETGAITGTTTDVAPGTDVVLTITGKDANGNPVTISKTVTTDASGNYSSAVTVADGIVDGSAVTVVANTTDRNGQGVGPATDSIAAQGDNDTDPTTPEDTGLDLVTGAITVDIVETGAITGTTTDVAPGTDVVLTITGTDANGNPVTISKTVTTDASGNYSSAVTVADGIVDGSAVTVVANTTDRNGQGVGPATDSIAAQGDNDTDPTTPEDTGLDLVTGAITVDIVETGAITGTTTDVAPGTDVVLTITGTDANGNPVTISKTVTTDASGNYSSAVTVADGIVDGSAVTVVANTTDRNGQGVGPATDSIAAQGDNDTDPTTPEDTGLDLVTGAITVDIVETGAITGTTTDVAPGTDVVLTITGYDENGEEIEIERTVQTDSSGNYEYQIISTDGIATGAEGSTVWVVANSSDNNGNNVNAQDSETVEPVVKGDTSTGITNGDDSVTGTSGSDLLTGDTGGLTTNFVAGNDYNISIVLDLSGSMNRGMDGSSNPDEGESRLDIAKAGLKAFIQQMVDHDGVINLQIASFSASGSTGNQYNQVFLNVSADNIDEIFAYIDALEAGGTTHPELGFAKAVDWFEDISSADVENQTYFITDGEPSSSQTTIDNAFSSLAEISKVYAVGVSSSISDKTVSRYDNTDVNGDKLTGTWNGTTNHGTAKAIADAEKLIAYLIGGSENFIPADVGDDTVTGGAGDDILFGDAMNTDWITGLDSLQYPQYSGYSKLIAYLEETVTGGAEPTQKEIYDFVKANYSEFIAADAADSETKGGNDTIYGGSGDDIIIAGAGNDIVYGGSGNDIISTGRGDDTIMYDVLNAADATAGNGTDTWVDYEANDKIEFAADFFDGLLADQSNLGDYITVIDDGNGNAIIQVDRDGSDVTHTMSDLLIIEGQAGLGLQDLIDNNQLVIG